MSRLALLLCLACPVDLCAGQVESGEVSERGGVYELRLDAVIGAGRDAVYAILSDHAGLHRLSHVIVKSVVLGTPGPSGPRRTLTLHVCILTFCFKGPLTEDVVERGPELIATTVVPELSRFRSGRSEWRLTALGPRRTRVLLDYTLEPAFWVPPLVGPWLIKRKMLNISREAIEDVETLAATR